MTEPRKQSLAILARIAEFLESLPENQLDDLESGAARLSLIPAGANEPLLLHSRTRAAVKPAREKPPGPDVSQIAEAVRESDSREAATALLRPLRKDPELKEIAAILSVPIGGNPPKDRFISAIVEATVGNRLDSESIRGGASLPY